MKELTIEEKAKAYDEAKARMSKAYNSNRCTIGFMNEIFPEFKDEDERIKEEIINYFKCQSRDEPCRKSIHDKWIAWIEKQGQTFTKEDTDNANKVEPKDYNGIDPHFGKPVDKVESKFKVGDWVVSPNGGYWHIDRIENNRYEVTSDTGKCACANWPLDTDLYHLWTIQDAKDGDVLIDKSGSREGLFIFKETKPSDIKTDVLNNPLTVLGYCGIGGAGFTKGSGWGDTANCTYYPAAKEQLDVLYTKIKEAGYEWDDEKKELKKISQRMISAEAKEAMYGKPAWSEEDEKAINDILWIIEAYRKNGFNETHIQMADNSEKWLKSLKQRIKL